MSDRLASIPPDHLLLMARNWTLGGDNYNISAAHVTKVLASAAARGNNEESGWLLDKLHNIPEFGEDLKAKWRWVAEIMATEDSPRAQYYQGVALWQLDEDDASLNLLRQSAEAGFAPAMSYLGSVVEDEEEKMAWFRKAAELNDPDGLYELARHVEVGRFELLCEAAARGHAGSMYRLANTFLDRLSPVEVTTLGARHVIYSGNWTFAGPTIEDAKDVSALYAAGRELDGYDQFWDTDEHPHESLLKCVEIYHIITRRARRAALACVLVLKSCLCRDVARIIAKLVYDSRFDAKKWYHMNRLNCTVL
jgi:hypothetical protein